MDQPSGSPSQDDTRERLLGAAHSQFAQRGFYGASIAQVAAEIGLTKQALLYHFRRKEDLYAEVLRLITVRLMDALRADQGDTSKPGHGPDQAARRFEATILRLYDHAQQFPLDSRVLLRELLDNEARAAKVREWYLRSFLDEIVVALDRVPGMSGLSHERKFACVYQILAAIEYFAVSAPTLAKMYGDDHFARVKDRYPHELRDQVRRLIECVDGC